MIGYLDIVLDNSLVFCGRVPCRFDSDNYWGGENHFATFEIDFEKYLYLGVGGLAKHYAYKFTNEKIEIVSWTAYTFEEISENSFETYEDDYLSILENHIYTTPV